MRIHFANEPFRAELLLAHAIVKNVLNALTCSLVLACSQPNPSPSPQPEPAPALEKAAIVLSDSLFGMVAMRHDTTCLVTSLHSWSAKDTILVVLPSDRRSVRATIGQRISQCLDEAPSQDVVFYQLNAPGLEPGNSGIAILARDVRLLGNDRTDIDSDGTPETYRSCASSEGLHLTVWAGEPLRGRRVWHHYYYLGYDLEPNCVEADYIER